MTQEAEREKRADAEGVIRRIAEVAHAVGWQAGVGAMETAGSIVSFLVAHPERIDKFMSGEESVIDWPVGWHEHGALTWQGMNGKIVKPQTARHARIIRELGKSANG